VKKKILIYGAGAIGRGYTPWLFNNDEYELYYVENNTHLRDEMNHKKSFTSYRTKNNKYESLVCNFVHCFKPGEENPLDFDGIITAVGPRQVFSLMQVLKDVECPIVLFENDSSLSEELKVMTGKSNFFFGVPDVITSNTASQDKLDEDQLSIITEDGVCFVENGASSMGGDIQYVDKTELDKQWAAKLFIHNTPHCIAAYLGYLNGNKYLHEGMQDDAIYQIVEGAMKEMNTSIVFLFNLDKDFVDWYSDKELSRFSNTLLFDPISRVAREPFRKLGLEDRLIGAAQLALTAGVKPKYLVLGIMSAFLYDEENDNDFHINILLNSLSKEQFLEVIIKIQPHEALYKIMIKEWDSSLQLLKGIQKHD